MKLKNSRIKETANFVKSANQKKLKNMYHAYNNSVCPIMHTTSHILATNSPRNAAYSALGLNSLSNQQRPWSINQGAFYDDPILEMFLIILLLCHNKANIEMVWPSHTLKPLWFRYCLANFTWKSFSLCMFEIGKILIYDATMMHICKSKIYWGK